MLLDQITPAKSLDFFKQYNQGKAESATFFDHLLTTRNHPNSCSHFCPSSNILLGVLCRNGSLGSKIV